MMGLPSAYLLAATCAPRAIRVPRQVAAAQLSLTLSLASAHAQGGSGRAHPDTSKHHIRSGHWHMRQRTATGWSAGARDHELDLVAVHQAHFAALKGEVVLELVVIVVRDELRPIEVVQRSGIEVELLARGEGEGHGVAHGVDAHELDHAIRTLLSRHHVLHAEAAGRAQCRARGLARQREASGAASNPQHRRARGKCLGRCEARERDGPGHLQARAAHGVRICFICGGTAGQGSGVVCCGPVRRVVLA